jgi:hypothetical protein
VREDAIAAHRWAVSDAARTLRGDMRCMALPERSAGGNLATKVARSPRATWHSRCRSTWRATRSAALERRNADAPAVEAGVPVEGRDYDGVSHEVFAMAALVIGGACRPGPLPPGAPLATLGQQRPRR